MQAREDDVLDCGSDSGNGKRWIDRGIIWEMELIGDDD